ncbi:hypothetical protein Tther_01762 [Tepidimonas thermarum]|uniref:Uncharacterized protein n=1 Tax=Tepidimonas thermarum TaxID=335431 RepID=A0A554WZF9_9BURK|nr:hypothetical protein [Tepidimonas thermarum]TSE28961.1 hypothetical protein Tther_01762 [Tepidimonas thermarum]
MAARAHSSVDPPPAPRAETAATGRRRARRGVPWVLAAAVLAGCAAPPVQPTAPAAAQPAPPQPGGRYDGGTLAWTVSADQRCQLHWQGTIHAGAVAPLRQALDAAQALTCAQRLLVLDGVDGTLGDAVTIGAMVRNRRWDTALAPGSVCRTPCWLVFAAGERRHAPERPAPAQVVFSPVPPDADFGHQTCTRELTRAQQLTLTRYLRAMLPLPTATTLLQKLQAADCRPPDAYGPVPLRLIGLATDPR